MLQPRHGLCCHDAIMSPLLKNLLWRLYCHKGPLHALTLQAKLMRNHGIAGGRSRYKRLPPGDLAPAGKEIMCDQLYFLKRGNRYGNIFKCQMRNYLLIVMIGNKSGLKFISENEVRLSSVFPGNLPAAAHSLCLIEPLSRLYFPALVHFQANCSW